ncbi:MAG: LLM class F420-dependent oxidoreductase, partial [Nitrososphaerota archaeon]|nr:LLM class F420-dependent oxidoreductase [Nitrososphaerota archaeon]
MKFGYQQPAHLFGAGDIFSKLSEIAAECEELEYDSFWIMDHLVQIAFAGGVTDPILEPYTALSAIASRTNKIRLGALCTCNFFRSPSLLAKMAATLDHISRGRFWMGIGAGWFEEEARMYGYQFPNAEERLGMLGESLQILKQSWTQDSTTFHGKYYRVNDLTLEPKPVQKPHPPILVGGGGEKITLRLVARYADACNLFPKGEELERKLSVLKKYCKSEGRSYDSILKTKLSTVFFGEDREDALKKALKHKPRKMNVKHYTSSITLGSRKDIVA